MKNRRAIKVHGHVDDDSENNFTMGIFIDSDILTDAKKVRLYKKMLLQELKTKIILLKKVKLEAGNQSENFVKVFNVDSIKDEQVLTMGGFMLLSEL